MTNPYLGAAQEVTGCNLGQAPNTPVPNRTQQRHLLRENVRKVHVPKPGPNQTIGPIPPTKLPQTASFAPQGQLGNLGALTGFSKIRKMLFLTAVGAGFAASLMYSNKLELLLLAEHSEFKDLRALPPKIKKAALPTIGLAAFPSALALFTDQEWKKVAWMCWLGAAAYFLKEVGGGVYGIMRDSNEAGAVIKEKRLMKARKKRAKRKS